ncbi:TerB family tellurite resistance protein [Rhodospirillaceae bacterium SYSU D60014]|uniref:TerB family tellurite resistance protein n=1 Tax=Virgifigura deserti TaxID=2268457 RepID=UPI000E667E89
MSIWGKILGGAAGFAIGGPIGALLGAVAGHAVDSMRDGTAEEGGVKPARDDSGTGADEEANDGRDATKQIAFTIAVIVLGAKMAKSDGHVTRSEVDAFKEVFRIPPHEMRNVGWLFDRARRDPHGFEPYARQIAGMFPAHSPVLEELLDGLFHIAKAEGGVKPGEFDFLRQVATIFGFSEQEFERIRASQTGPNGADPYEILGVRRDMEDAAIKTAYRRLIRETHPDRLVAEGMPKEFIELANEKMATINAAYDHISRERGIR